MSYRRFLRKCAQSSLSEQQRKCDIAILVCQLGNLMVRLQAVRARQTMGQCGTARVTACALVAVLSRYYMAGPRGRLPCTCQMAWASKSDAAPRLTTLSCRYGGLQ